MSMADRDGVIWLDGQLVPWREAKVHVLTHTQQNGLGVFEGVRAYQTDRDTTNNKQHKHTNHQNHTTHNHNKKMPYDKETKNKTTHTNERENKLASGYIRPMCFY